MFLEHDWVLCSFAKYESIDITIYKTKRNPVTRVVSYSILNSPPRGLHTLVCVCVLSIKYRFADLIGNRQITYRWLLITGYSSLTTHHWVIHHWLLITGYSSLITHHWLLITAPYMDYLIGITYIIGNLYQGKLPGDLKSLMSFPYKKSYSSREKQVNIPVIQV